MERFYTILLKVEIFFLFLTKENVNVDDCSILVSITMLRFTTSSSQMAWHLGEPHYNPISATQPFQRHNI